MTSQFRQQSKVFLAEVGVENFYIQIKMCASLFGTRRHRYYENNNNVLGHVHEYKYEYTKQKLSNGLQSVCPFNIIEAA